MHTDAQWGFVSEADERLIQAVRRAAEESLTSRQQLQLQLKDGEVLEGIPEQVEIDASNAPSLFNTPLDPIEREQFGPTEITITLDGRAVLAQEIKDFAVLPSV